MLLPPKLEAKYQFVPPSFKPEVTPVVAIDLRISLPSPPLIAVFTPAPTLLLNTLAKDGFSMPVPAGFKAPTVPPESPSQRTSKWVTAT